MVYPKESSEGQALITAGKNALEVIYDCGPVADHEWDSFDDVRKRLQSQWSALPKRADPISGSLKSKITLRKTEQAARNQKAYIP